MANNKRRARIQAQKSNRPSNVTGQSITPSYETRAFQDGIGRLGGKRSIAASATAYTRKPKHAGRGWE